MKAMLLAATVLAASSLAALAQPAPPGTGPGTPNGGLPAAAPPSNLDRLRGMQGTGTALELESIPQTGRKADQLRANLANIQLPPGFR